jgi:hypothetical protein
VDFELESAFSYGEADLFNVWGDFEEYAARCRRGARATGLKKLSSQCDMNPPAVRPRVAFLIRFVGKGNTMKFSCVSVIIY